MGEGSANNSPSRHSRSPLFKPFSDTWRNDLCWLWGPRTLIMCSHSLGNCDCMLSLTTGTGSCRYTEQCHFVLSFYPRLQEFEQCML